MGREIANDNYCYDDLEFEPCPECGEELLETDYCDECGWPHFTGDIV